MAKPGILALSALCWLASAQALQATDNPAPTAQPTVPYATVEVVVRPLFQRRERAGVKIYDSYEDRLALTQSVMDHVKYRLGNELVAASLFTSNIPLEIKFELLRFDIMSSRQMVDPVDGERTNLPGSDVHAIAVAEVTFDRNGHLFKRRYKSTERSRLKYTGTLETNKALLAESLDHLIATALADAELVAFLKT